MHVSLKLNVKLTWTDDRIRFQKLKKDFFQNKLSDDMAAKIWIPQPIFANNHDRVAIQYIPSSSDIFLVRNGSSIEAPLSQIDEAKVYHPIPIPHPIVLLTSAVQYIPSSSDIFLVRNGSSTDAPFSQIDEAKIYHPTETRIILRTMHHMKFKCRFNLAYFPFDYQTCYAVVCSKKIH